MMHRLPLGSDARDARFLYALISCVLVAGCAAATDSPTDPSDDDDDGQVTTLTDQQRIATIQEVWNKVPALAGTDATSRRAELLAFLQSRSEFEASGTNEDGSLWARFTDDRLLLIIANRDEPTQYESFSFAASSSASERRRTSSPRAYGAAAAPVSPAVSQAATVAAPPAELPASTQARVLGGLGAGESLSNPYFTTFIPKLESMLEEGGYQVVASGAGTIDQLMGISGDGVFYFGGHGGEGENGAGDRVYGVTTATPLSLRNDSIYRSLWLDGSLVYTINLTQGMRLPPPFLRCPAPCVGTYAFTAKFVEQHMGRFANGSVVYIAACISWTAEFRQAFIDKGAGVYFGWTWLFQADDDSKASLYLFDRLLGLNDPSIVPENPKQRPFDYVSVHKDMDRPGKAMTRSASARLEYQPGNTESGLLAPSIQNMHVEEDSSILVINGKFGSARGEVWINASQPPIKDWTKEQIRVEIPVSGQSSAGDVHVRSQGRRSNTRRLGQWKPFSPAPGTLPPASASSPASTNWSFNLQFLTGEGTLKWEGGVHLHIRADLGSYREEAGEPPKYRTIPFQIARDSYGELEASGSSGGTVFGGIGRITTRLADPAARNVVDGIGEIDTESPYMRLALYISVAEGMYVESEGIRATLPAVWGSNDGPLSPQKPLPSLYLPMDQDFGIVGASRRQVPTGPSSVLFWSHLIPNYIPSDTLAR